MLGLVPSIQGGPSIARLGPRHKAEGDKKCSP